MIHLYFGNGRGKTSIAVGTAMRMIGANKKVLFVQFMKGKVSSEIEALKQFSNVEILKLDHCYGFYKNMGTIEKENITKEHNKMLERVEQIVQEYILNDKKKDGVELLIVLDEITYPCNWGLMKEERLQEILKILPNHIELIMTGREPKEYMKNYADYVTELKNIKHPYEKYVPYRKGIEY